MINETDQQSLIDTAKTRRAAVSNSINVIMSNALDTAPHSELVEKIHPDRIFTVKL